MELVFAQDVTAVRKTITAYRNISLAVVPGAIILALMGGYVLSRRALSPVEDITRKARQITAESLSERLPVKNPNDEIGRLAFVFNQTLERLEASFDRLKRFTADASHELRTPLTSMRSVGEVTLQKNNGIQSYREAISSILEEIDRLTQLADNLLLLTRRDAGKTAADRKPVDAAAAVNKVIDELQVLAEDKNQVIKIENGKPLTVLADSDLLRQAFVNVIHNAVRYTQAGGEIKVRLSQNDHQQAVIDIVDNGPGIPKTERTKVFERFYRYDKGRSSKQGGGGLGLAIARQAVAANLGTIAFLDAPGPGAWCRIKLPLA
jgi:heavy metal sensor kinase